MNRTDVIALGLIATFLSTPVRAESDVDLILTWKGDQPTHASLGGVFPPTEMTLNASTLRFEARYSLHSTNYSDTLTLDATYGDSSVLSVPLRVWPSLAGIATTVYQTKYDACSPDDIKTAEMRAGTIDGALHSYFVARALYLLGGNSQCAPSYRKLAAKAWFDRSYELTQLARYYDLSSEAAAAYSQYDAQYVKLYSAQSLGATLRAANDEKLKMFHSGHFNTAFQINTALIDATENDSKVGEIALRLQGLSSKQLHLDQAQIAARARQAGFNLTDQPKVTLELAPKPTTISSPTASPKP